MTGAVTDQPATRPGGVDHEQAVLAQLSRLDRFLPVWRCGHGSRVGSGPAVSRP